MACYGEPSLSSCIHLLRLVYMSVATAGNTREAFFLSLSLCDVNKRHSLERLRYRRTQTMCDFIGGICGGTHSDNIQIFFFFFRGGGYELIFWSCTHSNTTKISSFRCKRTNSSSSPRRPGGAYVTSAAVTAVLSSNLTERSFQCHYPKLSIPLYCQIKPTCETNKL